MFDSFEVIAGDFPTETTAQVSSLDILLGIGVSIPITQVARVEAVSEESVKKIGGTIGWGLAGNFIFGPVGLLAGLVCGGKEKEVTFELFFKDGRKLIGVSNHAVFKKLKAAAFNNINTQFQTYTVIESVKQIQKPISQYTHSLPQTQKNEQAYAVDNKALSRGANYP